MNISSNIEKVTKSQQNDKNINSAKQKLTRYLMNG